jgi:hypothetical protein
VKLFGKGTGQFFFADQAQPDAGLAETAFPRFQFAENDWELFGGYCAMFHKDGSDIPVSVCHDL